MAKGVKAPCLVSVYMCKKYELNNLFINSISYDYPVRNELWALIKTERDNTIYL